MQRPRFIEAINPRQVGDQKVMVNVDYIAEVCKSTDRPDMYLISVVDGTAANSHNYYIDKIAYRELLG